MSSKDDRTLWLSRMDENDTQIGTDYEAAHAYWIPGDPHEALRAAIIFLRPEDKQPAGYASGTGCRPVGRAQVGLFRIRHPRPYAPKVS